nr:hypothetical protein GCM10020093_011780 [Planobispora longispora]
MDSRATGNGPIVTGISMADQNPPLPESLTGLTARDAAVLTRRAQRNFSLSQLAGLAWAVLFTSVRGSEWVLAVCAVAGAGMAVCAIVLLQKLSAARMRTRLSGSANTPEPWACS